MSIYDLDFSFRSTPSQTKITSFFSENKNRLNLSGYNYSNDVKPQYANIKPSYQASKYNLNQQYSTDGGFKTYSEKEIGFGLMWQKPLRMRHSDVDDCDSEDEVVRSGQERTEKDLKHVYSVFKGKSVKEEFPKSFRIKLGNK